MFHITQNEREQAGVAGVAKILTQFDGADEVYEGDSRDWLIGSFAEMDEDEEAEYRLIGTVTQILSEYEVV